MDFSNRNVQASASGRTAPAAASSSSGHGGHKSKDNNTDGGPKWLKIVWVTLLFAATILLVAVAALLILGNTRQESKYVNEDRYQAVFLDDRQIYFGKIRSINDTYIDLQNIYYLRVNQPVQPEQEGADQQQGNIMLQKLGCELHGPADQMIISREHVIFWENLRDDGRVAKAIAQLVEQNPEGIKCAEPSQQNNNSEGTNNQNNEEQQ
jgi:hypothetical protein